MEKPIIESMSALQAGNKGHLDSTSKQHQMKVWLIRHSETLPIDGENPRLMRMGLLAERLLASGTRITWWTSQLNYANKEFRAGENRVNVEKDYEIALVHSSKYKKNISLRRLVGYARDAVELSKRLAQAESPDLIVASLPSIEWAFVAARYAHRHGVPIYVDIRDTFPDMYLDYVPKKVRLLTKLAIVPYQLALRRTLKRAEGITASSEQYLSWALKYARRKRTAEDGVFPIAYPNPVSRHMGKPNEIVEEILTSWIGVDDLVCIFFGQFGHTVEIQTVIDAARELDGSAPVKFVLCGVGEQLESIKNMAANVTNVRFPGWVNQSEIAALGDRADVGLMAYRPGKNYEMSMPNKFGEYLALSTVIALRPAGVMRDAISEYECGFNYESGSDLAARLTALAKQPGVVSLMKANAHRLYADRFDSDIVYGAMAEHLIRKSSSPNKG